MRVHTRDKRERKKKKATPNTTHNNINKINSKMARRRGTYRQNGQKEPSCVICKCIDEMCSANSAEERAPVESVNGDAIGIF